MEVYFQMNVKMGNMFPSHKQKCHQSFKAFTCNARHMANGNGNHKANFYDVLSLSSKNVSFDDIKKAYKAMALQCHPDLYPPSAKDEATRRFVELKEAYNTLSDPISRRLYDYELDLANPLVFSGFCVEQNGSCFPKEVWERQLKGLRKKSYHPIEKKTIRCMQFGET